MNAIAGGRKANQPVIVPSPPDSQATTQHTGITVTADHKKNAVPERRRLCAMSAFSRLHSKIRITPTKGSMSFFPLCSFSPDTIRTIVPRASRRFAVPSFDGLEGAIWSNGSTTAARARSYAGEIGSRRGNRPHLSRRHRARRAKSDAVSHRQNCRRLRNTAC